MNQTGWLYMEDLDAISLQRNPPKCSRCRSKPSIYYRPYSGERLCAGCFADTVKGRVEKTIARFNMFEHDSRIAVAVSGGKDSLNLLRVLKARESILSRAM